MAHPFPMTRLVVILAGVSIASLVENRGFSQQTATTVQLPSLSSVSVSTTVSAPDAGPRLRAERANRGSLRLGGLKSARNSSVQRGPLPQQRAIAQGAAATSIDIQAQIHDFAAEEEKLLGSSKTLAKRPSPVSASNRHERFESVAVIRAKQSASGDDEPNEEKAREYLVKANRLQKAGSLGLAKNYYRLAAKYGTEEQIQLAKNGARSLSSETKFVAKSVSK